MSSMSDRDRKIMLAIVPLVVILAYWFLLLSPKKQEVSTASAERTQQEQQCHTTRGERGPGAADRAQRGQAKVAIDQAIG